MNKKRDYTAWLPVAIAISTVVGIVVGIFMGNPFSNDKYNTQSDRKLNMILNLIAQEYVDDSINTKDLVEMSIPLILSNLDPHSSYLTPKETKASKENLAGKFQGIGVVLQSLKDTAIVMEVIQNGPSDRAGLMPGDKIVTINDSTCVGPKFPNTEIAQRLRGPKGTKVKVGIKRNDSNKLMGFELTRGDIPSHSVASSYMIDKTTGYVNVTQFISNTHMEFVNALNSLKNEGAKRFIVDLRGNPGGYVEVVIGMVNEFLPANRLIMSSKSRYRRDDQKAYSDGRGLFQDEELVVLIDETSASASEIFAGAIQDNDRGLIVGSRSFGKGLIQKEFPLPDHSSIHLTVAKYYTPSGRCIQKPYDKGLLAYQSENIIDRYSNGELFTKDSIKIDTTKVFLTTTGRKVYGGGGIIPDIFVPIDTTSSNVYFRAALNNGLFHSYALKYASEHRSSLSQMSDYKQLLRNLPANDDLLNDFVNYAAANGIPTRWYYIRLAEDRITSVLKAFIARDILGQVAFYPIINRGDKTIEAAMKALNKHKAAFPITNY